MFRLISLLLPALLPSWKFFKNVEPSPRIEWRRLYGEQTSSIENDWLEYYPRPQNISPFAMLGRLIWNPQWNEYLYTVSLAERHLLNPTSHSHDEIIRRIAQHENSSKPMLNAQFSVQFRLLVVHNQDGQLIKRTGFISRPIMQKRPTNDV